jgi:hypothetical protein
MPKKQEFYRQIFLEEKHYALKKILPIQNKFHQKLIFVYTYKFIFRQSISVLKGPILVINNFTKT